MKHTYFICGVPCTGKTWLGSWLAEKQGYLHVDAEKNSGADLDVVGIRQEWDLAIRTGRAEDLVRKIAALSEPVVLNWGFPMSFLYFARALQVAGIETWWIRAEPFAAKNAFIQRGGIDVRFFDRQISDIVRHSLLLELVFGDHIIGGLNADGAQRSPEELWNEVTRD